LTLRVELHQRGQSHDLSQNSLDPSTYGPPVELFSELDDERWELRRIELYRDGSLRLLGSWIESDDQLAENAFSTDSLIELCSSIKVLPFR
jgi:hypothetical protein